MNKLNKKIQYSKTIDKPIYTKKKAFIWLALFPPYGLYRLFKHRLIHRGLSVLITLLFIIIIAVSADMIINPFRVQNDLALKSFNEFNASHKNLSLGQVRFVNRVKTVSIGNKKSDKYDVITKNGKYEMFLGSDSGKDYKVEAIYETIPERELKYVIDSAKANITDTFPEIIEFINSQNSKFGEYKSLIKKIDDNTEEVKTSNGTYRISLKYDQVYSVKKIEGDKTTNVYEKDPDIKLIDNLKELADKNKNTIGEVKKVLSYELYPSQQSQNVLTDKGEYMLVYHDDGSCDVLKKNANTTIGNSGTNK